jgi:hypothetical protein
MTCIDDLQSTAKLPPTVHTVLSLNSRLCWTIENFQAEKAPNSLKRASKHQSKQLVSQTAICQGLHLPNHKMVPQASTRREDGRWWMKCGWRKTPLTT